MATRDDLNTPVIAVVGLLGAIVVFALIVLLMVVFHRVEARQRYARDVDQPYAQVTQLLAEQQGRLAGYGWVDQKKGIAHVPIDRTEYGPGAMDLVVAELLQDPNAAVTGAAAPGTQTPDDEKGGEDAE